MSRSFCQWLLFAVMLLITMLQPNGLMAQEKDELKLLAHPLHDTIQLRWAPTSYRFWLIGNQYGYLLSRTLIYKDGQVISNASPQIISTEPFKPAPLEKWLALGDSSDAVGIAVQSIYGDRFEIDNSGNTSGMTAIFDKANEQQMRLGFALFAADIDNSVAQLSGLAYNDAAAERNSKYLYKLCFAQVPEGVVNDTAVFFTGTDEFMPTPAPANLNATGGDRIVSLTWERLGQEGLFSGYYVERSDDNGSTFHRLNTTPLINTTPDGQDDAPYHFYIDSIASNQVNYQYRVRGVTPFGELSPRSNTAIVHGKKQITTVPAISKIYSPDNQVVKIEWEQSDVAPLSDCQIKVLRSDDFAGRYLVIGDSLSATARAFTDAHPLSTGYYRLMAFNKDGNGPQGIPQLIQLEDSIPPAAPTGLVALADTSGKVVLRWKANQEPDLDGYRVFRANSPQEEFSQITSRSVEDTLFVDQIELQTLTKKVYYRLTALDKRQNHSVLSEIFEVERPDIVPPSPASFRGIESDSMGIAMKWYSSNSSDVAVQYLYRNSDENSQWTLIAKLAPSDSVYCDTTVHETLYSYLIVTADKAGNESSPTKPVAAKYSKPLPPAVWITPKVRLDKKTGLLIITWDKTLTNATYVMLYGKNQEGQWSTIMRIENNGAAEVGRNREFEEYKIR